MTPTPGSVISIGYGVWGSPGLVLTLGFGSSGATPVVSTTLSPLFLANIGRMMGK